LMKRGASQYDASQCTLPNVGSTGRQMPVSFT
jgi:hypothetical protein